MSESPVREWWDQCVICKAWITAEPDYHDYLDLRWRWRETFCTTCEMRSRMMSFHDDRHTRFFIEHFESRLRVFNAMHVGRYKWSYDAELRLLREGGEP